MIYIPTPLHYNVSVTFRGFALRKLYFACFCLLLGRYGCCYMGVTALHAKCLCAASQIKMLQCYSNISWICTCIHFISRVSACYLDVIMMLHGRYCDYLRNIHVPLDRSKCCHVTVSFCEYKLV